MTYLDRPGLASAWTVVVLCWRPGSQKRIDFVKLIDVRYGLGLADAKKVMEQTLEAPADPARFGATDEHDARALAARFDSMGAEVRVLAGNESTPAVEALVAARAAALPRLLSLPTAREMQAALAAVAPEHRLT